MKAAKFDYERPESRDEAIALLAQSAEGRVVKCLAGGQSLGPMLNLRLVQPDLLVDLTAIPELGRVEENDDGLLLGGCITHGAIEDQRVPDSTGGILPGIARGIAYRAVRTRGTIGGSLVHADPAADWMSCLAALGAEVWLYGPSGTRQVPVAEFMVGAFETVMRDDEILDAVYLPKPGPDARWGFYKVCRKTGEFAQAIGALLLDPDRGICRAVAGATETRPIVIEDARALFGDGPPWDHPFERRAAQALLHDRGMIGDEIDLHIHVVALERAARALS